jgi:hypothetical protein
LIKFEREMNEKKKKKNEREKRMERSERKEMISFLFQENLGIFD